MKTTIVAVFSAIVFLLGVSYLYYPEVVLKANKWIKEKMFDEKKIMARRTRLGTIYILLSFIIFSGSVILPKIRNTTDMQVIKNNLNFALYYYNKGRLDDAEKAIRAVMAKDKENIKALEQMCLIYYDRGDLDKAKFYCRKILKVDPDNEKFVDIYANIKKNAQKTK